MMLKRAECRRSRADYSEMRFNLWYCESGTGRFRGASGNNLLILKTRGSLWDGGTGEKGEISIILPEECKKGVVYKPKADHYFTFDKPNRDGPVTLVRHEGYVIGFDTER